MATKKKAAKPPKKSKSPAMKSRPRPAAKKAAKRTGGKPMIRKPAAPPARSKRRPSWLDEQSNKPTIERHARQLRSFLKAMEDGNIDESELAEQEQRLVGLMREIEPQLDDALHARVTELLCELTAYDLMQTLHSINAARPRSVFQG
jgi:hypothetical protein